MVEIDSLAEHEALSELVSAEKESFYIGFDSIGKEAFNLFTWRFSGERVKEGFTCWWNGEPSPDPVRGVTNLITANR